MIVKVILMDQVVGMKPFLMGIILTILLMVGYIMFIMVIVMTMDLLR
jgi:hypothetical protein